MKIDITGLEDTICVVGVPFGGLNGLRKNHLGREVEVIDQRGQITQLGSKAGRSTYLMVLSVAGLHVRCLRMDKAWSFGVALGDCKRLPQVQTYLHQDEQDATTVALVLDIPDDQAGELVDKLYVEDFRTLVER